MRTLVLADIHSNLTALEAVLDDAKTFERVWCLGDVVGYGPDPNACIERLRSLPGLICVKGNHDAAILGEIDIYAFNYEAQASLEWLEHHLQPENRDWLSTLEERISLEEVTIVHGSPRNPIWEYIMDLRTAQENMSAFETRLCLVGHTHIPCVFQMESDHPRSTRLSLLSPGETYLFNHKAIINPGSVGQPRDHDPRSAYMIYDDETNQWTAHRVAYNFEGVQNRIRKAGLPERHAARLAQGW